MNRRRLARLREAEVNLAAAGVGPAAGDHLAAGAFSKEDVVFGIDGLQFSPFPKHGPHLNLNLPGDG